MRQRFSHYFAFILVFIAALITLSGCSSSSSSPAPSPNPTHLQSAVAMSVSAMAGDGRITLSWSAVTNATSYNIYRSETQGVAKTGAIAQVSAPSTSYIDTSVTNGTTYYYLVTSLNGADESDLSTEVSAKPVSGSSTTITVSGTVRYEDKKYDVSGFTGVTSYKAVRFAAIDVVNAGTGATIYSGSTDANGVYYVPSIPSGYAVYVRVNSSAIITGATTTVEVKSLSPVALYGVPGNDFTPTGDVNANISIPVANTAAGAFNILDVYTSAFQFVHSLTSGVYPPSLAAYWQKGNPNGTFFCTDGASCFYGAPPGAGIYVLNYLGDTDEFDDDVLYHEFGHFVAANFSHDDSPGGAHYLTSNDLDMRLSWSEGWGDFFPGAIKSWLSTNHPELLSSATGSTPLSQYVDTTGTGVGSAGISIDIASPGTDAYGSDPYVYATSEMAVAKVLWNLMAGSGNYGMPAIWSVMTGTAYTDLQNPNYTADQVNLETFWDGWLASWPTNSVQAIFSERKIDYNADSFEGDGSPNVSRKYIPSEKHTLYPASDADYVAFVVTVAGTKYTITTSELRNGADTYIQVLDPSLSPVASNDNSDGRAYSGYIAYYGPNVPSDANPNICDGAQVCHENGYDVLGSRVTSFTALTTGTYFVKITSSPNKPVSAGRYGTYKLSITSP